jgi:hypothetical protein
MASCPPPPPSASLFVHVLHPPPFPRAGSCKSCTAPCQPPPPRPHLLMPACGHDVREASSVTAEACSMVGLPTSSHERSGGGLTSVTCRFTLYRVKMTMNLVEVVALDEDDENKGSRARTPPLKDC